MEAKLALNYVCLRRPKRERALPKKTVEDFALLRFEIATLKRNSPSELRVRVKI